MGGAVPLPTTTLVLIDHGQLLAALRTTLALPFPFLLWRTGVGRGGG